MARGKKTAQKAPEVQDQLSGEQDPEPDQAQTSTADQDEDTQDLIDQRDDAKTPQSVDKQNDNETPDDGAANQGASKAGTSSKSTEMIENMYTGAAEELFTESAFHPDSMIRPYNPDKLVRKDWAYRIYEDMLEDDQVSIAMDVKKDLILGSGFYFESPKAQKGQKEETTDPKPQDPNDPTDPKTPAQDPKAANEDDDEMQEIKDDLMLAFEEKGDRAFSDILRDIMQAYEFGFSISEKIFNTDRDGKLFLKDCKPRHPSTWLLHTDKHGNMTRYEQRGLHESVDADPASVIHYINNPKFQNPYGKSDLYVAFQAWMTKRHITRFYAIFLEKAASPTPVGKYDRRADQTAIDAMYDAIKKFQTKTALVIPKEFEIEFLEAKSTGDAYVKGICLFNMFIGRAMFLPDLLGFQGEGTSGGSHALGEHQIEIFMRHIHRRRELLQRIVNKHFVQPFCMFNYGLTENFPMFRFNPLSDEEALGQADQWVKGITTKAWTPTPDEINHFRKLCKFPQSSVVDTMDPAQAFNPDGSNINPNDPTQGGAPGKTANPAQSPNAGQAGAGDTAKGQPTEGQPDDKQPAAAAPAAKAPPGKGPAAANVKKKFEVNLASIRGTYAKKVDFTHIDDVMRSTVSKILVEAKPIVEDIFEDLYDQIHKKKIVPTQKLEKADSLDLKYKKRLQLVFKKNFRHLWSDAQISAHAEVSTKDHVIEFEKAVASDEFLDLLDQETFQFVGDWEYSILKKARVELAAAIKDGKPLSEVIGVLDDEGMNLSDASLERFARTKTTEVFNKGRMAYFDETDVVSAYQFSAVLDDRTSDICAGLDNCVFDKDDAPVPPMHFNCRSVLVPITKFEDYETDDEANNGEDMDKFIDSNKGAGFPRD